MAKALREFGGIRVDSLDWPIIVLEYPEAFSDDDTGASLTYVERLMHECLNAGGKCAQITDLSRIRQMPPASQRKIAGDWVKRNAGVIAKTSVGGAGVSRSAVLRGVVTAVHWFHRPTTPMEFFPTRPLAIRYVIGLLDQGNVVLEPRLRELGELGQH